MDLQPPLDPQKPVRSPTLSPALSPCRFEYNHNNQSSSPEMYPLSDAEDFLDFDQISEFSLDYNLDDSLFNLFIGTPFKQSVQRYKETLKKKQSEIKLAVDARKSEIKRKLRNQATVSTRILSFNTQAINTHSCSA